jgi:diaminopimelate decarboxylase
VTVAREHSRDWWHRPGLRPRDGRLLIAGRDAETLAREHGTPLYVYDLTHIEENLLALRGALARTGVPYKLRLALKAQREPQVLSRVRALGAPGTPEAIGLDVCSPGEVEYGLAHGFAADELSFTGTNVSERDLDVLLEHDVHVNLDLITQIHRYGRRSPGGTIGLRVNSRVGAVRPESGISYYSGDKPTKFGIYPERLDEAIAAARSYGLTIDTIHFHVSHHLLTADLPAYDKAVEAAAAMARRAIEAGCPIREVNAGGGIGAVMQQGHQPLDLDGYAGVLAKHLGPLGVTIACEPGEWVSKNAGVLLAEVVSVEDRSRAGDGSAVFAGLDCGWNIVHLAFIYKEPIEHVLCSAADAPRTSTYTMTSHINEGPDIFAEDYPMPELHEGDVVALLGVGCYCQANWNLHCLRAYPDVVWFEERLSDAERTAQVWSGATHSRPSAAPAAGSRLRQNPPVTGASTG